MVVSAVLQPGCCSYSSRRWCKWRSLLEVACSKGRCREKAATPKNAMGQGSARAEVATVNHFKSTRDASHLISILSFRSFQNSVLDDNVRIRAGVALLSLFCYCLYCTSAVVPLRFSCFSNCASFFHLHFMNANLLFSRPVLQNAYSGSYDSKK